MKTSIMCWDFGSPSATVAFGGHIKMKLLYRVLYSGRILQFPRLLLCLCIHLFTAGLTFISFVWGRERGERRWVGKGDG